MPGNPLIGMLQNGGNANAVQSLLNQNSPAFGPFGNIMNMMTKLSEFRKTCGMTNEQAKEKVMSMLNSGQATQEQLNQLKDIADMFGIK